MAARCGGFGKGLYARLQRLENFVCKRLLPLSVKGRGWDDEDADCTDYFLILSGAANAISYFGMIYIFCWFCYSETKCSLCSGCYGESQGM